MAEGYIQTMTIESYEVTAEPQIVSPNSYKTFTINCNRPGWNGFCTAVGYWWTEKDWYIHIKGAPYNAVTFDFVNKTDQEATVAQGARFLCVRQN